MNEIPASYLVKGKMYQLKTRSDFQPPDALDYLVSNYTKMLGDYLTLEHRHEENGRIQLTFSDPKDTRPPRERFNLQLDTSWLKDGVETVFIQKQGGGRKRKTRRATKRRARR
jgi:hypothetical protein